MSEREKRRRKKRKEKKSRRRKKMRKTQKLFSPRVAPDLERVGVELGVERRVEDVLDGPLLD